MRWCPTFLRTTTVLAGILVLVLLPIRPAGAGVQPTSGPFGLFSFHLPSGWILQVARSEANLQVYHATDSAAALYIEVVEAQYKDVQEAADRIVAIYDSPWGLANFAIREQPLELDVGGFAGLMLSYSYQTAASQPVFETRVITLYRDHLVSVSVASETAEHLGPMLEDVLATWRWIPND